MARQRRAAKPDSSATESTDAATSVGQPDDVDSEADVPEPELVTEDDTDDEPVVVSAAPAPTYITPQVTVQQVRIGSDWYSFHTGVSVSVPDTIVPHLKRIGVI